MKLKVMCVWKLKKMSSLIQEYPMSVLNEL